MASSTSGNMSWALWYKAGTQSAWHVDYSVSYTISVNRPVGTNEAIVTVNTTMSGADWNTNGWFANLTIGNTLNRFQIASTGRHDGANTPVAYPPGGTNRIQTHSETINVAVGGDAGQLSVKIKFEIAPHIGSSYTIVSDGLTYHTDGYSLESTAVNLDYGSAGESCITNISGSSWYFGTAFNVTVHRYNQNYRESLYLLYGDSYSTTNKLELVTKGNAPSGQGDLTFSVTIPRTSANTTDRYAGYNFRLGVTTYESASSSTKIGSDQTFIDNTNRAVRFSDSDLSTFSSWTGGNFGYSTTVNISRKIPSSTLSTIKEIVTPEWNDGGTPTMNSKTCGNNASSVTFDIPKVGACPPSATSRLIKFKIETYNATEKLGTKYSSALSVSIKSGDTDFIPTIGDVTNTVVNTISGLGTQAVIGTSKVYAQLPIGNVSAKLNASIVATEIKFSDGKTKTGGNATISETSNTIDRASYVTTFKVTDSRGLTATKTATVSAINVTSPSFSSLDVYRANSSGQRDDTGTYIYAIAVPSYQQTIGSVTNVCTIQMSVNGGSAVTVPASTLTRIYDSADTTQAYTVSAVVSDLIHSATTVRTIGAESVSFNIKNEGDGIGIGKYSVHSNAIDLAYDIYTDANVIHKNYQNTVAAGGTASIDNAGKGLTTYYIVYCGLNSSDQPVSGTDSAGVIIMYEGQQIMKEGFTGLTTSISGTTFNFGFSSGSNKLKYRVFENSLGSFT